MNPITRIILNHLDGKTSLDTLYTRIARGVIGIDVQVAKAAVKDFYDGLHPLGCLCLIHSGSQGRQILEYSELVRLSRGTRLT